MGRVQIEKEKSMSDSGTKGTALITGASRGIGAVYADRLAKRGYNLVLVGRSEAQLKALSARLTKETGRSVAPLRANLSDKADLEKVESLLRENQAITMLVNNAGIGAITPLLNTEVDMDSWESSACYPRRTFYPLSDGPPHTGPPDHYGRLSSLLDLSVSQSGRLVPLHSTADFRPA